jgi:hypothetical protein
MEKAARVNGGTVKTDSTFSPEKQEKLHIDHQ